MKECTAYISSRQLCKNGFPQNASCVLGFGTPYCCNEKLCGRLFASFGGKPPDHLVDYKLLAELKVGD